MERGADQLGRELDKLPTMTLQGMADTEDLLNDELRESEL